MRLCGAQVIKPHAVEAAAFAKENYEVRSWLLRRGICAGVC